MKNRSTKKYRVPRKLKKRMKKLNPYNDWAFIKRWMYLMGFWRIKFKNK